MADVGLDDEIRLFLREHVESYEELEIILLLWREPGIACTVTEMSLRLNMQGSLIEEAFTALLSRGILLQADLAARGYRLSPSIASLDALKDLAQARANRPVEIIKLMNALAIERMRTATLRTFANAFVFKKDKDRG